MKELEGFFDQMVSYQVAMNLLYVNGQYNEALEVFEQVQDRRIGGVRYPKNCFTLALACCYKMVMLLVSFISLPLCLLIELEVLYPPLI